MSTPQPIAVDLARRLVRAANATLRAHPEAAAAVDAAVACFVECPAPSTYLRAARLLGAQRLSADRRHAAEVLAPHLLDRAHKTLAETTLISDEDKGLLAHLAPGPQSGPRLSALCALLEAHEELAGRIRRLEAERRASIRPLPVDNPRESRAARPARATRSVRARR